MKGRVLLGILSVVVLGGCANLGWIGPQDLRVDVLEVTPGVPTKEGLPITLKVSLDNRSGVNQKLKSVKVRFRLNEEPFVEAESKDPVALDASHPVEIKLPIQLAYGEVGSNLKSLARISKNRYTLDGEAYVEAVPSPVVVPFHKEGTIGLTGLE